MMHGMNYVPPDPPGDLFADNWPASENWGLKWAEQAYRDGLLPACGTQGGKPLFCPLTPVSRDWGAYLIVVAKNLPLP